MKSIMNFVFTIVMVTLFLAPAFSWAQNITLGSVFDSDNRQADVYRRSDAMSNNGDFAICKVLRVRNVKLEAGNTTKAVATTAGGILGGAIGARNTNNSSSFTPEAAIGGILGAVIGNAVVQKMAVNDGQEYLLNCGGKGRTVVQEDDGSIPAPQGAEVYLVNVNGRPRVTI